MLFAFPEYQQLASAFQGIAGLGFHAFSIARYDNQEMHAAIPSHLTGERCFIVAQLLPRTNSLSHSPCSPIRSGNTARATSRLFFLTLPMPGRTRSRRARAWRQLGPVPS